MSKKPISIKDKPSKKALLDELESIKHLLDDEDSDSEPPLLTQEVSAKTNHTDQNHTDHNNTDHYNNDIGDDFPVLTDSLDEDSIPTLDATFEEDHGEMDTNAESDDDAGDDIVSRAMKAQSLLNSQPPLLTNQEQETAAPKSKSLFDDDSLDEELSPEMIALNARTANKPNLLKPKPPEPKPKDIPNPADIKKVMPTKPEPKKFLSLEEELNELAKNMVDEAPAEHTLDDAESNEILEEFDDYLEEDYLSGDSLSDNELTDDDLPDNEMPDDESIDNASLDDISTEEDENGDVADAGELFEDDSTEVDTSTEDDIELEAFTDFEEKEADSDDSEDSLLAAAILEVTDSISDGEISEHIQESLSQDDLDTQPSSVAPSSEHQPSLFDAVPSADNDKVEKTRTAELTTSAESAKANKKPAEKLSGTASTTAKPKVTKAVPLATKPMTENPFLPKHIRDRLHTNRTLQQEIDASSTPSPAVASTGEQEAAPVTTSTRTSSTSFTKMTSEEDRVVEEVIGSVLPKIESELRQKIIELIKQERSKSTE